MTVVLADESDPEEQEPQREEQKVPGQTSDAGQLDK
jgi:hypothetical protein